METFTLNVNQIRKGVMQGNNKIKFSKGSREGEIQRIYLLKFQCIPRLHMKGVAKQN